MPSGFNSAHIIQFPDNKCSEPIEKERSGEMSQRSDGEMGEGG
jgi:hypothetical protein